MSTTIIAMFIAFLLGVGLLLTLALLSLFSGAVHTFVFRPKILILKSRYNDSGFAFAFIPGTGGKKVNYDRFRIRFYNPFGDPSQIAILREFEKTSTRFARDLYLGPQMKQILSLVHLTNTTVELEVASSTDAITHKLIFKGPAFLKQLTKAQLGAIDLSDQWMEERERPRFEIPERTFIAETPGPNTNRSLKIATNPQFVSSFEASTGAKQETLPNFKVSKVWIEPGCIVCNACEGIYPEVFHVTETTCLIRPNAPLDDGLKIKEAADACPVEVIKFTKAG